MHLRSSGFRSIRCGRAARAGQLVFKAADGHGDLKMSGRWRNVARKTNQAVAPRMQLPEKIPRCSRCKTKITARQLEVLERNACDEAQDSLHMLHSQRYGPAVCRGCNKQMVCLKCIGEEERKTWFDTWHWLCNLCQQATTDAQLLVEQMFDPGPNSKRQKTSR